MRAWYKDFRETKDIDKSEKSTRSQRKIIKIWSNLNKKLVSQHDWHMHTPSDEWTFQHLYFYRKRNPSVGLILNFHNGRYQTLFLVYVPPESEELETFFFEEIKSVQRQETMRLLKVEQAVPFVGSIVSLSSQFANFVESKMKSLNTLLSREDLTSLVLTHRVLPLISLVELTHQARTLIPFIDEKVAQTMESNPSLAGTCTTWILLSCLSFAIHDSILEHEGKIPPSCKYIVQTPTLKMKMTLPYIEDPRLRLKNIINTTGTQNNDESQNYSEMISYTETWFVWNDQLPIENCPSKIIFGRELLALEVLVSEHSDFLMCCLSLNKDSSKESILNSVHLDALTNNFIKALNIYMSPQK